MLLDLLKSQIILRSPPLVDLFGLFASIGKSSTTKAGGSPAGSPSEPLSALPKCYRAWKFAPLLTQAPYPLWKQLLLRQEASLVNVGIVVPILQRSRAISITSKTPRPTKPPPGEPAHSLLTPSSITARQGCGRVLLGEFNKRIFFAPPNEQTFKMNDRSWAGNCRLLSGRCQLFCQRGCSSTGPRNPNPIWEVQAVITGICLALHLLEQRIK